MAKHQDRSNYLICLLLVIATLAVYLQVRSFGFVNLDDVDYVSSNPHVLGGITPGAVAWAFTSHSQSNWHPLTWISLMVDAALGKGDPGVFHLTNLALHMLNTLLLFVLLQSMTGLRWRSAAVAALFAIHPLHVESVAWITERKDVLSTFFWLLAMLAYVWYAKQRSLRRYVLVLLAFVLGLMAKPMLVSLPLVLLLIDIWPLRRIEGLRSGAEGLRAWWPLVWEKIPLFAVAAVSCAVTVWAQSATILNTETFRFSVRAANALVSYSGYIVKMVCPLNLSVLYPHPESSLPAWQVVSAALFFAMMFVIAIKSLRSLPFIAVGWLWYVLTLLPVIGLVQVGEQSMADRYTYVPLIGLFIILAWGVPELLGKLNMYGGKRQKPSPVILAAGGVLLVGLMACTYFQVGYWRDSIGIFGHAVAVDEHNYLAHAGLGEACVALNKYPEAISESVLALKLSPNPGQAHYKLGAVLDKAGRTRDAAVEYLATLHYLPDNPDANNNLGILLAKAGRIDDAIEHFNKALEGKPDFPPAHINLGWACLRKGDLKEAANQFRIALRLDPDSKEARRGLEMIGENKNGQISRSN